MLAAGPTTFERIASAFRLAQEPVATPDMTTRAVQGSTGVGVGTAGTAEDDLTSEQEVIATGRSYTAAGLLHACRACVSGITHLLWSHLGNPSSPFFNSVHWTNAVSFVVGLLSLLLNVSLVHSTPWLSRSPTQVID